MWHFVCLNRKPGYCAPYNGTVCKKYLGNSEVFYNNSSPGSMGENEQIVMDLLKDLIEIEQPNSFCRVPAEKMLCHYAFPNCDKSTAKPEAKPLCRFVAL